MILIVLAASGSNTLCSSSLIYMFDILFHENENMPAAVVGVIIAVDVIVFQAWWCRNKFIGLFTYTTDFKYRCFFKSIHCLSFPRSMNLNSHVFLCSGATKCEGKNNELQTFNFRICISVQTLVVTAENVLSAVLKVKLKTTTIDLFSV